MRYKQPDMKKSTTAILIVSILYTIYQIWLNGLYPYISDDFYYQYITMYHLDEKVQSIQDIIYSQYLHYNNINGRSIIHAIEQFVLLLSPDKVLFNILNAIVWVALLYNIVSFASPRNKHTILYWLIAIIYLRFLSPAASYLPYWASGCFNYYWTLLPAILFLRFYYNDNKKYKGYLYPIAIVTAFLLGWSHETLIPGILMAMLYSYLHKDTHTPLHRYMILSMLVGFVIMLCAPGNWSKMAGVKMTQDSSFWIYILVPLTQLKVCYILTATLLWGFFRNKEKTTAFISQHIHLFIIIITNLLCCMFLGVGDRALFFTETFAFIALLAYISQIEFSSRTLRQAAYIITPLLVIFEGCVAYDWARIYGEINRSIGNFKTTPHEYVISEHIETLPITDFCITSTDEFWNEQYNFSPLSVLYKSDFRIIPAHLYQAIADGTLIKPENRMNGALPFYTTGSIDWAVMPCDTPLHNKGEYCFNLYPPSLQDPNLSLSGIVRRIAIPHTLPTTAKTRNYSTDHTKPYLINDKYYVILRKPQYQRPQSVFFIPQ